jgi:hypothetical protein
MIMNEKDIHILVNRFFEGKTSNEEEKELYSFFNQENIPLELKRYKLVFRYFEKFPSAGNAEMIFGGKVRPKFWTAVGIAAAFMAIVGLNIYKKLDNNRYNPYEGSYIIRNGVKITDPKTIRPEIEKSLYMMAIQNEIEKRKMQEIDF